MAESRFGLPILLKKIRKTEFRYENEIHFSNNNNNNILGTT
jgi:hypothetical protein